MIRLPLLLLAASTGMAQTPFDRLQRADGTHILPDRFLRRWDPVTILLDADTGPAQGGPEDNPARIVTLEPTHPGAWTWLGPRTLQFRPAEPWEPLRREPIAVAGQTTTLVPLLPLPISTGPTDTSNGVSGLDTIGLTFPDPVEEAALHRLLTIELKPQTGGGPAQTLSPADYDLRPMERAGRSDKQAYRIALRHPVPDGLIATIRLRLSDEPGLDDPTFELALRSAAPFTLTDTYCGDGYSHSTQDNTTLCTPDSGVPKKRRLILQFSAAPDTPDIVRARDLLRFTPPVDDLTTSTGGENELRLDGAFAPGTTYTLSVAPGTLKDTAGRVLTQPALARFSFKPGTPLLIWDANQGIIERLGPQRVPLRGFGYDRADIRIVPVDPLSRDFWPFPRAGLITQDDQAPPLPGNEPRSYVETDPIAADAMAERIQALGTPAISALIDLPIRRGGVNAKFGIDLAPHLAKIAGPDQPGTYLVGLGATDGARQQWMRVQVTDLVLTTIEEPERVRFLVTSLATAAPVPGAEIRLEGVSDKAFHTLARGVTGPDGAWIMTGVLPKARDLSLPQLRRITVVKGGGQQHVPAVDHRSVGADRQVGLDAVPDLVRHALQQEAHAGGGGAGGGVRDGDGVVDPGGLGAVPGEVLFGRALDGEVVDAQSGVAGAAWTLDDTADQAGGEAVTGPDEAGERGRGHDRLADFELTGAITEAVGAAHGLGAQHEHGEAVREFDVHARGAVRAEAQTGFVERDGGEVLADGDVLEPGIAVLVTTGVLGERPRPETSHRR